MAGRRMRRGMTVVALVLALGACSAPSTSGSAAGSASPAGVGEPASETPHTSAQVPTPIPACRTKAKAMSTAQQSFQVLMVGVDPSLPAPDATTSTLLQAGVGSLLYIPATTAPATQVKALSDALHKAAVPPLITVDQEGGQVVRLTGPGFSPMPGAAEQAQWDTKQLRAIAAGWAKELRAAGIDVDLAPVADVVPPANLATNEPVAQLGRGYGSSAAEVSPRVAAFAQGFADGGVGVALKHYPGLGRTTTNTDFGAARDDVTTLADAELGTFRDNATHADLVMVSSVLYTKIDANNRAVFSPTVMASVRKDLGFEGPIVSDDLGAAAAVADLTPGQRAVAFVGAGGDLVITVDPSVAEEMALALQTKASAEPAFAARLADATERILALKAKRGLLAC